MPGDHPLDVDGPPPTPQLVTKAGALFPMPEEMPPQFGVAKCVPSETQPATLSQDTGISSGNENR